MYSEHTCPYQSTHVLFGDRRPGSKRPQALASWLGSGLSNLEPGPGAGCADGLGLVWLGLSAAWPGSADGLGRAVPITKHRVRPTRLSDALQYCMTLRKTGAGISQAIALERVLLARANLQGGGTVRGDWVESQLLPSCD
ncbi:hypothetical protein JB92DRAFT_852258 [Gautieria morchelliformis]|nr:hypothetical protein JB92DRAFT_852258 [Gautieria morchelliformis]